MKTKHINRIGIELEGGWNRLFDDGSIIVRDSSVTVVATHMGELPSPPLRPQEAEAWLLAHYPDAGNSTCGMHIHISLKSHLNYVRLMRKPFWEYFQAQMERWGEETIPKSHEFWKRLSGGSSYCKRKFHPDLQVREVGKGGGRYTQLNFCWNCHGTVECRLFPYFESPTEAWSAITALLTCIETYLSRQPREKAELVKFFAGVNPVNKVPFITVDSTIKESE